MAYTSNILEITLDGTGTESALSSLSVTDPYEKYILSGAVTAIGNYAIVPTGTPQLGTTYVFEYEAVLDITTNGTTFSLFGTSFNQTQLTSKLEITCYYNGSAWKVKTVGSLDQAFITSANFSTGAITTAALANDSITDAKLATMTVSSLKYGDSLGDPGNIALGSDQVAVGNGTTIVARDIADLVTGQRNMLNFEVGFLAASSVYKIYFPITLLTTHIHAISLQICEIMAGTDNGILTVETSSGVISNFSGLAITASAVPGTQFAPGAPADNYDLGANSWIKVTTSKTTAGGKLIVAVDYEWT